MVWASRPVTIFRQGKGSLVCMFRLVTLGLLAVECLLEWPRELGAFLRCAGALQLRLSPTSVPSAEPEELVGASSPRPSPLLPESLESESVEAADGEPEPDAEAPGSSNSEPGTPRAGRSAIRAAGSSRAERCAGVHISDPYNVNLPLHISSILSVPPNIISNVALARLTRGLECPALQPRPSPASGPGPGPGLGPGPPGEDPGAAQHWERGLEPQVGLGRWGHRKLQASGFGWVTSAGSLVQGWGTQ